MYHSEYENKPLKLKWIEDVYESKPSLCCLSRYQSHIRPMTHSPIFYVLNDKLLEIQFYLCDCLCSQWWETTLASGCFRQTAHAGFFPPPLSLRSTSAICKVPLTAHLLSWAALWTTQTPQHFLLWKLVISLEQRHAAFLQQRQTHLGPKK